MQKLSEKAPLLVVTAILLGIVPHALMLLGIRGFPIGLTFFCSTWRSAQRGL
jgi:hypothetical protein